MSDAASKSGMTVGRVLNTETGTSAMVVTEGADPLASLLDLLEEVYGGDRFSPTNPAIVAALADVAVEEWRTCTADWLASEGLDLDEGGVTGWWASEGDGPNAVWVLSLRRDAYCVAEDAEDAEASSATPPGPLSDTEET